MNSTRKRKSRSPPRERDSHLTPESKQRRVRGQNAAGKEASGPTFEQASATNSSQRRSLRTTTKSNAEPTKTDKVQESTPISSEDNDQTSSSSKRHNTRLRNGIHKARQKIEIYDSPKDETEEKEKEKTALIDSCARELAELDNDSFQRARFRDANKIFEKLLLPMHFPWNHKAQRREQVLRGLPCDIDELLAHQTPDDSDTDDNEEYEFGKTGKMICNRSPQDKGLIELSHKPSSRKQRSRIKTSLRNSVTRVDDDVAFRMYQEVQSRKLHRQTSGAKASCSLVSIQCNGVSSEASIFTDVPDGKTPVLLPAIQPRDVVNGKRMSVTKAKELSKQLGSYDCRYGLPDISNEREQSGRRRRVFAGRTRTIWTRREDAPGKPTSPSAQPTYTSIITGETLPAGSHKRPLPVKVGLKVNGKIVTVDKNEKFSADSLDKIDEINKALESGSTSKKSSNAKQSNHHQNGSRKRAR